jgi:uncharacterized membrane protein YccC
MSLPHLRDWHFAGVRIGNTMLGALVAVIAMLLLWPEREQNQLSRLLGYGASADAAYVRALLRFWAIPATNRLAADREFLAPARRRCGLAINDAEETLDRMLLEPSLPLSSSQAPSVRLEQALSFVTYLRRLTRTVTTLALVGTSSEHAVRRAEAVAARLDLISAALLDGQPPEAIEPEPPAATDESETLAEQQLRRVERQSGVLQRAAAAFLTEV